MKVEIPVSVIPNTPMIMLVDGRNLVWGGSSSVENPLVTWGERLRFSLGAGFRRRDGAWREEKAVKVSALGQVAALSSAYPYGAEGADYAP